MNDVQVLVYNSYIYPTLEKMKKLRHVVLLGVCDNQTLSILGQGCNCSEQFLGQRPNMRIFAGTFSNIFDAYENFYCAFYLVC